MSCVFPAAPPRAIITWTKLRSDDDYMEPLRAAGDDDLLSAHLLGLETRGSGGEDG